MAICQRWPAISQALGPWAANPLTVVAQRLSSIQIEVSAAAEDRVSGTTVYASPSLVGDVLVVVMRASLMLPLLRRRLKS